MYEFFQPGDSVHCWQSSCEWRSVLTTHHIFSFHDITEQLLQQYCIKFCQKLLGSLPKLAEGPLCHCPRTVTQWSFMIKDPHLVDDFVNLACWGSTGMWVALHRRAASLSLLHCSLICDVYGNVAQSLVSCSLGYGQVSGSIWCNTDALVVSSFRGKWKCDTCWVVPSPSQAANIPIWVWR